MNEFEIDTSLITDGRLVEGAFAENEEISSVHIPEGVIDIGEVAFYGCTKLRKVVFPSTLRYIREEAFGECAIESAILPAGLELIAEEAFFSCDGLKKIEIPGRKTLIESDAFSCCNMLHEGFIAPGYPDGIRHHEELQYTLLWCSCPERHDKETSAHAAEFIEKNEDLIMEWIIKYNNIPAMNGLAGQGLLKHSIDGYIQQAHAARRFEISAMLVSMAAGMSSLDRGEFDL